MTTIQYTEIAKKLINQPSNHIQINEKDNEIRVNRHTRAKLDINYDCIQRMRRKGHCHEQDYLTPGSDHCMVTRQSYAGNAVRHFDDDVVADFSSSHKGTQLSVHVAVVQCGVVVSWLNSMFERRILRDCKPRHYLIFTKIYDLRVA